MKHMQQGHPVVLENNPGMIRYNRRHAPQPGYWGARDHLGGYGNISRYGMIGGKDAKKFFADYRPAIFTAGGVAILIAGYLAYQKFFK